MEVGREKAEFNDALGYLTRINNLFYIADAASMNLNAYQWFHALMALYRELSTKMNQEELESLNTLRNKCAELVNKQLRNPRNIATNIMQPELYNELDKFELRLRKIYKDSGLEMKFSEDPHFSLQG